MGSHKAIEANSSLNLSDWRTGNAVVNKVFKSHGFNIAFLSMPESVRSTQIIREDMCAWFVHVLEGALLAVPKNRGEATIAIPASRSIVIGGGPYALNAEGVTRCIMLSLQESLVLGCVPRLFRDDTSPSTGLSSGVTTRSISERQPCASSLPFDYDLLVFDPKCGFRDHYFVLKHILYVVIEGTGYAIKNEGRVERIEPGYVIDIKPGTKHSIQSNGTGLKIVRITSLFNPPIPTSP